MSNGYIAVGDNPFVFFADLYEKLFSAWEAKESLLEKVPHVQLGDKDDGLGLGKDDMRFLIPGAELFAKGKLLWDSEAIRYRVYEDECLLRRPLKLFAEQPLAVQILPRYQRFNVAGTKLLLRGAIAAAALETKCSEWGKTEESILLLLVNEIQNQAFRSSGTMIPDTGYVFDALGDYCEVSKCFYELAIENHRISQWLCKTHVLYEDLKKLQNDEKCELVLLAAAELYVHLCAKKIPKRLLNHDATNALRIIARGYITDEKQNEYRLSTEKKLKKANKLIAAHRSKKLRPMRKAIWAVRLVLDLHKRRECTLKRAREDDLAEAMPEGVSRAEAARFAGIYAMAWDRGYEFRCNKNLRTQK
tara:strand:- start:7422 stop:8504 length:1083 start_codon:yes stop_codon:yes gene_type:complete